MTDIDLEYSPTITPISQPTHDTPEAVAALAEAIHQARQTTTNWKGSALAEHAVQWDRLMAKRALAALDGWTLVPRVATADWTGSTKGVALAAIDAVQLLGIAAGTDWPDGFRQGWRAAREAVSRLPDDAVPDAERLAVALVALLDVVDTWGQDGTLQAGEYLAKGADRARAAVLAEIDRALGE